MPLDPVTGKQLSTKDFKFFSGVRSLLNDPREEWMQNYERILHDTHPQNLEDLLAELRASNLHSNAYKVLSKELGHMNDSRRTLDEITAAEAFNQGSPKRVDAPPGDNTGRYTGVHGVPARWRTGRGVPNGDGTGAAFERGYPKTWKEFLQNFVDSNIPVEGDSEEAQMRKVMGLIGPSALGILAGVKGATNVGGDVLRRMRLAEEAAQGGRRGQNLWREFGMEQGLEGKMRFEIPDTSATLKQWPIPKNELGFTSAKGTMGQFIDHPELFKAYPDLARVPTTIDQSPVGKYYSGVSSAGGAIGAKAETKEDMLRVLLHELQHGVQKREGFLRGTNLKDAVTASGASRESPELIEQLAKAGFKSPEFRAYGRHAGEVEARNVEWRWANPNEAQLAPSLTEDIFRNWQLRGE